MRRSVLVAAVIALLAAWAAPALGQDIRDRLTLAGTTPDGVVVTAVVVDDFPADFMSVATLETEPCISAAGVEGSIRTLTNMDIPDALVDVPQLLKGVEASGTGTQFVTVTDGCTGSFSTTPVEGVATSVSGLRTSKTQNFGNATFTGTGSGTLTVGDVTVEVTIDFARRPLG